MTDNDSERMTKSLTTLIAAQRILVVGDLMLDRYWSGSVTRISPEAPVPVVSVDSMTECVGGAGNVAANIRSIGAQCRLLSIVGDDASGRLLDGLLADSGVDRHLHIDMETRTTEKLRVVSLNQQLIRVDFEGTPSVSLTERVLDDYERLLTGVSVVVISDYGKGGLSNVPQIIRLAHQHAIPVVVDPKGVDFSDYRGATIVTPNTSEFVQSVGDCPTTEEFNKKAYSLIEKLSLQGLLVTRGPDGMTLFAEDGTFVNQSSNAKQVYDVSGAGDTVVAAIAVFLACGMSWSEILEYANTAAGIVVGKFGTATVTLPEIVGELERATA